MVAFNWGGLAEAFIARFPQDTGKIFRALLTSETLMSDQSHSAKVAEAIIKNNPHDAWKHIADLLESENLRRHDVVYWLSDQLGHFGERERTPPVVHLPADAVIGWAKEDPEHRAIKVLQILPKTVDPNLGGTLTVRFIEEFCNTKEMAGSLEAHFWTGSWSGPESLYLEKKRDTARQWLAAAQSAAVVSWLSQYITHLNTDIETAKIRQEREF
jgi:hypothetical protein